MIGSASEGPIGDARGIRGIVPLGPGATAPDFEFTGPTGAMRLTTACRERGAFVAFFALAGAPVSRNDLGALAKAAGELGAPARPLLVVSVDSKVVGTRFVQALAADLLIHVSDPTLELAAAWGVRRADGFAAPATFLVGRDGRIVASAVHPIGFPRPPALLRDWLAAAGLT